MTLYKRNAKGEPLFWNIEEYLKGDIRVSYGVVGGHIHEEVVAKKLVKANEIESRIKAKRKEGYKEVSELKDNAPTGFIDSISLINYLNTYLPKNNTTSDGFVLPMLAKVLKDNKPFAKANYIGQWKINGVRCIIGAEKGIDLFTPVRLRYWSREGTEWTDKLYWMDSIILPCIKDELLDAMIEEGACLDGELYIPGQTVNNINSFVKNEKLPQHQLLQYWCYDVLINNMTAANRSDFRRDNINKMCYDFTDIIQHLNNKSQFVLLPDVVVNSIDTATRYRDKFINLGFEGLIIRDANAEYQFGKRNSAMFKYKRVDDGKFKIIDIVPEGVRTNLCKLVLQNDINDAQFECTLNASHDYQEMILKDKDNYIGKYAIIEFRERSGVTNVPFHAKAIKIN
jgi:ATP-dependent DNA ligase